MKASVVDLRYKMNDVLKALDRNEEVTVTYRGKVKGKIIPRPSKSGKEQLPMNNHPFFGSRKDEEEMDSMMDNLRGGRYQ